MKTVLVVEDDKNTQAMMVAALQEDGYSVIYAEGVTSALSMLKKVTVDMVILDLRLPDGNGLDICRRLREAASTARMPVIAVTGEDTLPHKERGFDAGVDQYLTKPIRMEELLLCMKALFRRIELDLSAAPVRNGAMLRIDKSSNLVSYGSEVIDTLTPREFSILAALADASPRIFSRGDIIQRVWKTVSVENLVDTHIFNLRKKLPLPLARSVQSVPGRGFRFLLKQ